MRWPIALLLACSLASEAAARSDRERARDHEAARRALARREILPITTILELARQAAPGEVIRVELERTKTGFEYEVKTLSASGRIREVELDARTGAVTRVEDD